MMLEENPKPFALNPKPETLSPQPYFFSRSGSGVLISAFRLWGVVSGLCSRIHGLGQMFRGLGFGVSLRLQTFREAYAPRYTPLL